MGLFTCYVCKEKDARINDLKLEIANLRSLVFPTEVSRALPLVTLEANSMLNPQEETIEVTQEELDLESEATRILVGNYDHG